jgi:transposase
MDRREAEIIFDLGKEAVIEKLLEMDARIRALEQKIASLLTNSTNSSKPPSSDGPKVHRPKKKKSSRFPGGQIGHKGSARALLPAEEMDDVQHIYPHECEQCLAQLNSSSSKEPSGPQRYQHFEIPKIEPIKTEYCLHELECSCGHRTRAKLPVEVSQSSFGPGVHAAAAYLTSVHRATRRGIVEIMNTFFGLDVCLGSVCNMIERMSSELEPVVEEAKETLTQAGNLNIDETGWRCKGIRRYLWVFVSPLVVCYFIAASRGAKVLKSVLGDVFEGVITSDDHSAYSSFQKGGVRQLCWAHIIRKLKALKDSRSSPDAYLFARNMLKEVGHIFSCWHAFREGFISRDELLGATTLMRARMRRYCNKYQNSPDGAVRTRAKRLSDNWPHLFTFLTLEGVEPTNNAAEVRFVDQKPISNDRGIGPKPKERVTLWLENLIPV